MARAHVPGLAATVVENGRVVFARGYGWADVDNQVPVGPDTLFMLASVSKTMTGTALMTLFDEGRFSLDDPVASFLSFPLDNPKAPGIPITFRHLLTHTSSLRDNWDVIDTLYVEGDSPIGLGDFLRGYLSPGGDNYDAARNFNPWAPGTTYDYSNIGFALVGHLVERISGKPFDQYCRERIFRPLGMSRTSWFLRDLNPSEIALPYRWTGSGWDSYGLYGYPDYPDGQLRTSAMQLASFLRMHMLLGRNECSVVLEPSTASLMRTHTMPDASPDFGLAFYSETRSGGVVWGHNGGDLGVATWMFLREDRSAGVVLLTNGGADGDTEWRALEEILDRLFADADSFSSSPFPQIPPLQGSNDCIFIPVE